MPPHLLQRIALEFIIDLICLEFLEPKISPRLGDISKLTTFMMVPEAAVYKNDSVVFGKDHIRPSWISPVIFAEAEALLEKPAPHFDFGFGVSASYAAHIPAPLYFGYGISHPLSGPVF